MIKNIYALFDKQTNTYQNPLHFINHGDAVRWLTSIANPPVGKEDSIVSLYPHQFVLIHTATYDDATGKFENVGSEIMQASEVKETVQKLTLDEIYKQFAHIKEAEQTKLN